MASTSRSRPLSKKEQQEEEIRERVKDSPFYYEKISLEEMKEIEKMQNNHVEAGSTSTSEKITKNTSDLSEHMPQPTFSYRKAMSNNSKYSLDKEFEKGDSNLDCDLMSSKSNLNNENSNSNGESICNKNASFANDDYPPLSNKFNVKHNKEFQSRETRKSWNQRRNPQDRWRLNPLDYSASDPDPLHQPERVHISNGESLPYLKNNDVDDVTFTKLCQQMSEKLDIFHKQFTMGSGDRKWGSPIKATGKWIESSDKTTSVEKPVLHNDYSPEPLPFRDTHERATKRKALTNIHAACISDSSDENSEGEFDNKKKRKCQQGKKGEEGRKNQGSQKNINRSSFIDMIDVSDSNDVHENLNVIASTNNKVNQEAEYPRRIIPPNPQKKNYKGPRGKKRGTAQSQNSSLQKYLNDEEIQKTLSELTEEIDGSNCTEIITEIKPAQVPKSISSKISVACSSLQKAHAEEDEKIKAAEEAKRRKEKEELMKKDELISRRLQEEEEELQRKTEQERKLRERDESYRNRVASKHQKVTRSTFLQRQSVTEVTEEELLNVDDDDVIPMTDDIQVASTTCPICHKDFPNEQIETHASECDAFSSVSDEISISQPSTSRAREMDYNCEICNSYSTYNGNDFSEHVNKCKEKAEDRRNGIYA